MRLKFRAWHEQGFMLNPDNIISINFHEGYLQWAYMLGDEVNDDGLNYFDQLEIMQSTGLNDKNGVEIYEGDIIECKTVYEWDKKPIKRAEVVFENGVFSLIGVEMDLSRSEIIGNIYENPELLKSEE